VGFVRPLKPGWAAAAGAPRSAPAATAADPLNSARRVVVIGISFAVSVAVGLNAVTVGAGHLIIGERVDAVPVKSADLASPA
jgi:hypothetical protein